MVQGLAFLSKKSWHTKNLANQEKVWMAEQRSEAEAQKTKDLAKQIQQEREQEELEKISGKKGPKLDRGIDWMYQGTTGELAKEDAERKAEEFLLGKEYVPEGATQGDFDNGDQDQGINSVLKKQEEPAKPASSAFDLEPSVKDRNEDFRLRVEDPMFFVSQKQREKVIQHDKTKALYERVVGYEEDDHRASTKSDKKETTTTKEKKRHKKHKKSKSRKRDRDRDRDDDSDSQFSDDDSRHHRRRSRSRDRDLSRSKRYKRSSSSDRDVAHRSRDARDLRRDRGERRYREDDRSSRKRRHESNSDDDGRDSKAINRRHDSNHRKEYNDRDGDRDDRRRGRHDDSRYHEDHHHHSHSSHGKHDRRAYSQSPSPNRQEKKKEGYGLKGASVTVDPNDLGPNRELLQKKREEREAERRKIRETASARRQRTEEERVKALEEMQANARKREESRSSGTKKLYGNDDDAEDAARASKGEASFIKDVTRQTYGIAGEGGQSLASRVAQNRHTNQRMNDSFL